MIHFGLNHLVSLHNGGVNLSDSIQTLLIYALPVLFAITLHEAAHGYVAHMLGDDTAWLMGRVTLNPMAHIDLVGTILLPVLMYLSTAMTPMGPLLFGFAKPVPVRFGQLRQPKRDMVWVALAGPGTNFLQALLWWTALYLLLFVGVQERFFLEVCKAGILTNVVMFVFNLFPLPPLDGGRIAVGLLPMKQAILFSRIEPWGFYIVMALVLFGVINGIWMQPFMGLTLETLRWLMTPIEWLLG